MKLSAPALEIVSHLIMEGPSASHFKDGLLIRIEDPEPVSLESANTTAIAKYSDLTDAVVIYNRIDLSLLFGLVGCRLRTGMVDWYDQNETVPLDTLRLYDEVNTLYSVLLTNEATVIVEDNVPYLVAKVNSPIYMGRIALQFYSSRYNSIPLNLLTGFDRLNFKGNYTLIPMNPYPIGGYLYTSDEAYDPNGEIYGEWVKDTPLILSGDEYEMYLARIPHVFETLDPWVKTSSVAVICLSPGSDDYNAGNAVRELNAWRITNVDSPIYGTLIPEIRRDEMTTGILTHMTIWKETGYLASADSPEYRHHRVG